MSKHLGLVFRDLVPILPLLVDQKSDRRHVERGSAAGGYCGPCPAKRRTGVGRAGRVSCWGGLALGLWFAR
jgi:hypothetical protein